MRKAIIVILAVVLLGFGGYSLYLYLGEQETEQEAFARQQEEADLADAYLQDIAGRVNEQESYLAEEDTEEEELETLVYETLKRCLVWKELCIVQLSGEDYDALLQMVPNSQ